MASDSVGSSSCASLNPLLRFQSPPSVSTPSKTSFKGKGKGKVNASNRETNEEESSGDESMDPSWDRCGICYSEERKITRGYLNCCDHHFCFVCIMEWAKVESRCPMCKRRFSTIRRPPKVGVFASERVVNVPVRDQTYHNSGNATTRPYVQCRVCHSTTDDSLLLLCGLCDSGAHTYCIGLGLTVPEGGWFCHDCATSMFEHANGNRDTGHHMTEEDAQTLYAEFRFALVGKFFQHRPSMESLKNAFKAIGFTGFDFGWIDSNHVLMRFSSVNEYYRCWRRGAWIIAGCRMNVSKWTSDFQADAESLVVLVWLGFAGLPLHLFNPKALFLIASLIGVPIRIDSATAKLSRPSVARICVEVDISNPLPSQVWIQNGEVGFFQSVCFENLLQYCSSCLEIGHKDSHCSSTVPSRKMSCKEALVASSKPVRMEDRQPEAVGLNTHETGASAGTGFGLPQELQQDQPEPDRYSGEKLLALACSGSGDGESRDGEVQLVAESVKSPASQSPVEGLANAKDKKGKKALVDEEGFILVKDKKSCPRKDSNFRRTVITRSSGKTSQAMKVVIHNGSDNEVLTGGEESIKEARGRGRMLKE